MTSSTYEAWADGRPVYNRLPDAYQENEVADWLAYPSDYFLSEARRAVSLDLFDPLEAPANWLDFLAACVGYTGEYWDAQWPESSKRILIARAFDYVWPNAGTLECLSFVLTTLGIPNSVRVANAFLIGISLIGDEIGYNPWNYEILVPRVIRATPTENLVRRINSLFGPCWCESSVIFDNSILNAPEILGDGETSGGFLISTDGGTTVLGLQ
jgi:hypothetical protein